MRETAIIVEGLGKRYRLGQRERYRTLRDALADGVGAPARWLANLGGRRHAPGPGRPEIPHIWALRDVSFEVRQGDVVGIVGSNGAGKSTLLKILSRITEPTEGRATVRGRVASLLEVGTGFHPELTGRENVYLNGAILGMRRAEIDRKFDEIVAFAELERFVDTPVKRYSSGMYVRLAFAVSAHLESEILLVDEVLAVGDAAFQLKCLGKMNEVTRTGRTVLFVSHNAGAVTRLCQSAVWLEGGRVVRTGDAGKVVTDYLARVFARDAAWESTAEPGGRPASIRSVRVVGSGGAERGVVEFSEPFVLELVYELSEPLLGCTAAIRVVNADGVVIFESSERDSTDWETRRRSPGLYRSGCTVPGGLLRAGRYSMSAYLLRENVEFFDERHNVISLEVTPQGSPAWDGRPGILAPLLSWDVTHLGDGTRPDVP
jgi:lipopolysaccharide transport system ATP-binding protein